MTQAFRVAYVGKHIRPPSDNRNHLTPTNTRPYSKNKNTFNRNPSSYFIHNDVIMQRRRERSRLSCPVILATMLAAIRPWMELDLIHWLEALGIPQFRNCHMPYGTIPQYVGFRPRR